jgi:hypothetical protein
MRPPQPLREKIIRYSHRSGANRRSACRDCVPERLHTRKPGNPGREGRGSCLRVRKVLRRARRLHATKEAHRARGVAEAVCRVLQHHARALLAGAKQRLRLLFQSASKEYVLSSFRGIARVIVKLRLYIPPLQFVIRTVGQASVADAPSLRSV